MTPKYAKNLRYRINQRENYLAGKARNNRRRTRRKQIWLTEYKSAITCVCGARGPHCIDFHHRDPTLKTRILARLAKYSLTKIQSEILKCEPMCANCHRNGHAGFPRPEHEKFFINDIQKRNACELARNEQEQIFAEIAARGSVKKEV